MKFLKSYATLQKNKKQTNFKKISFRLYLKNLKKKKKKIPLNNSKFSKKKKKTNIIEKTVDQKGIFFPFHI